MVADDIAVRKIDKENVLMEFHSLVQERDNFFFNCKDI